MEHIDRGILNRQKIEGIRGRMQNGVISIDQAMKEAQPLIDDMNKRGTVLAKSFGKKHKKLTFSYIMR